MSITLLIAFISKLKRNVSFRRLYFFLLCFAFCLGCKNNDKQNAPVKVLDKGDFWISDYYKLDINKAVIAFADGKLYCSTIVNSMDSEKFYCLDLTSDKVLWAHNVRTWADYPPIILNDVIYYTTYLGDRYAFDNSGKLKWCKPKPSELSFKEQAYNPINHNLFMSDVINGFYEFDKKTGKEISFTAPCDSCIAQITLPVFINHYMYFATHSDTIYRPGKQGTAYNSLICKDYDTKRTVWAKPFKQIGRLYTKEGNLYFINNGSLYCINGSSGDLRWEIKLPQNKLAMEDSTLYNQPNRQFIYRNKSLKLKLT